MAAAGIDDFVLDLILQKYIYIYAIRISLSRTAWNEYGFDIVQSAHNLILSNLTTKPLRKIKMGKTFDPPAYCRINYDCGKVREMHFFMFVAYKYISTLVIAISFHHVDDDKATTHIKSYSK